MKREEIVLHRSVVDTAEQAAGASRFRQRFTWRSSVGAGPRSCTYKAVNTVEF
jgi:hypothetical protein